MDKKTRPPEINPPLDVPTVPIFKSSRQLHVHVSSTITNGRLDVDKVLAAFRRQQST